MKEYQVLSFNLRVNTINDGKYAWTHRKPYVFDFINKHDFSLIGFQEITPDMYVELNQNLSNYKSYGIGRDAIGEATPIFVKKNKFMVIESKTQWLSETPDIESKIDGSYFTRIVTYVILRDGNNLLAYFNTHLDYASDEICKKQTEILVDIIEKIQLRYQCEIILTGDFNQYPESQTINYLNQYFISCYRDMSEHVLTFHGFTREIKGLPIDYIYFSKIIKNQYFKIIHEQNNQIFLSDHYPIMMKFSIEK